MPDATNGGLIITVLSFNGTPFGIAQNISADLPCGIAPLQNQGMLGTAAIGITSKGGVIVITWIAGAGSGLFARGTTGSMVYTTKDAVGGGTKSRSAPLMVALDGKLMHSDRQYAIFSQTFMNQSDSGDLTDFES